MDTVQPPEDSGNTEQDSRLDPFRELARAVADSDARGGLPLRLCSTFVSVLGADGGAITLEQDRPERTTVCATDEVASRLEDLQEVYDEGPGADAFATGSLVAARLAEATGRWPLFVPAARAALGPLSVHAFPMRTPGLVLGVATVYHRQATPLAVGPGQAQLLADAIGVALAGPARQAPWPSRDRVNQAIGMVIAQLGVSPDDALALLRAFAFSRDLTLDRAATTVVERRHVFDLDDSAGGSR